MFENIETNRANFCVGPQAGTYCTVDDEVTPVVMHVKNDIGVIIRTYSFYPQDTLHTGPAPELPLTPDSPPFTHHEFIAIQYIGPYDQASYFDGAIFYTLEKRAYGRRKFYTYENEEDPEETEERVEYRSNIVRKWLVDDANFRLILDKTYFKDSDEFDWYNADTFAVDNVLTTFDWHTATGTGVIEVTTTSGLKKYDTLFLGPSSDTTNVGEVEEVYVHSINGTTVEIKTYSGADPPQWEYMQGDPITLIKDIFMFSGPSPAVDLDGIQTGYTSTQGTLYKLDQTNYGETIDRVYNGIYRNVKCATWNNYYGGLSFVKGSNILHLDVSNYEVIRSQDIHLESPEATSIIDIYGIDIKEASILKLQRSIIQHDNDGEYYQVDWETYNYHVDTFLPYANTVTLQVSERVLLREGQSFITAIVRDQFGVGLLGKNVWFTAEGDINGELTPVGGYMTTDSNGLASIQYDAGNFYTGSQNINIKVDGGNSVHGSVYVLASTIIQQFHEVNSQCFLRAVPYPVHEGFLATQTSVDQTLLIAGKVAYTFPGDGLRNNGLVGWENNVVSPTKLIQCQKVPTLTDGEDSEMQIKQSKILFSDADEANGETTEVEHKLYVKATVSAEREISSNYISRHLSYGHTDSVALDQFIFVQDARPAMYSKKNNVNTDFWIRLRPFAADLDPSSLVVKLREESPLAINQEWQDVTALGVITMWEAAGAIYGIDFFYNPINDFHHNAVIHIDIEVYDTTAIPNIVILEYWFKIIQDYKAPYIINQLPAVEAYDVVINSEISFDLVDEGEGVDISTLEVFINQRVALFTYDEYEPGNYHIYVIHNSSFQFGQSVHVDLVVQDKSDAANKLLDGWRFYCVESTGPWFDMDNTIPKLCVEGLERNHPVSMQIYGINDTGIDYDSIRMEVGGRYRNLRIIPVVYRLS